MSCYAAFARLCKHDLISSNVDVKMLRLVFHNKRIPSSAESLVVKREVSFGIYCLLFRRGRKFLFMALKSCWP